MGRGGRFGGGRRGSNRKQLWSAVESRRRKGDIVQLIPQQFDCRHMKPRTLAKPVHRITSPLPPSSPARPKELQKRPPDEEDYDDDEEEEEVRASRRRKKKRIDESEEELKLLRLENKRLLENSRKQLLDNSESDSQSTPSSTSEAQSTPSSTSGAQSTPSSMPGSQWTPSSTLRAQSTPSSTLGFQSTPSSTSGSQSAPSSTSEDGDCGEQVASRHSSEDKIAMVNGSNGGEGKEGRREKLEGKASSSSDNKGGPLFKDFGGLKKVLDVLETEVLMPFHHSGLLQLLGVRPISGILLHGPPGCGKTKLAHAIANEIGVPFYKISAAEAVSRGEGEYIRDLFSKAYKTAPSIIFIDEIDAIGSKRESLRTEMERRIVTQLMTCMDEYHKPVRPSDGNSKPGSSEKRNGYVLVIGATNRPDDIDSALRRPGRFDREIMLGVPDEDARVDILSVLTKKCMLEGSLDLHQIARLTSGFVGADLDALTSKAGNLALWRIASERRSTMPSGEVSDDQSVQWWKTLWSEEEMEKLAITMGDFEQAAMLVQPSLTREGFSSVPNVTWEDVGGLQKIRNELESLVVQCVKNPNLYQHFGVSSKTGILLYGPPGCGKTLIAKAAANEAGANFIHVKGPELLNQYVGESERAVRSLFTRARLCLPCIIFIDEVDALTTTRGRIGGWVVERLLNQLLIELDGADQRQGVFVIGATNRPEVMDPAVLRPGRLGNHVLVPLPSAEDHGLILKALARGKPVDPTSVDLAAIAQMEACENLSGADLNKLMEDAAMAALREAVGSGTTDEEMMKASRIKMSHFEQALAKISPSVTTTQVEFYEAWSKRFGGGS